MTGECIFGAERAGVGCFTDNLRGGQRPAAHDGQQGWGNRGYPDGDLGGEFVDLVGDGRALYRGFATHNANVIQAASSALTHGYTTAFLSPEHSSSPA